MKIGFVGLGHMGRPMVKNLLKAGYTVSVYDVMTEAINACAKEGAIPAKNLKEIAQNQDVIFTMLQTGQQVKDVCLNPDGLFHYLKKDALYIDSSSIEVKTAREISKDAHKRGIASLDAPVSGGTVGAESGSLTFMVGGEEDHYKRALPLLEKLGKKIVYLGKSGSGQAAKICNNLILGISMIAVSEGFSLGEKLGLDPKKFFEIASTASSQCWSMTSYCPVPGIIEKAPSNHNYRAGFMTKMMLKDLRLAQDAAKEVEAFIPLGSEAAALFTLYNNLGNGDVDFSGIINLIKEKK